MFVFSAPGSCRDKIGRMLGAPRDPPVTPLPLHSSPNLPPSPLPSVHHPLLHSSTAYPSSVPVGRGSLKPPPPTSPPSSFPVSPQASHSVLLHKVDEGCALHLHRLPLPVIHGQHEVEEVGFPEVGRGLLLKVCSCQAHTTVGRKAAGNHRK